MKIKLEKNLGYARFCTRLVESDGNETFMLS